MFSRKSSFADKEVNDLSYLPQDNSELMTTQEVISSACGCKTDENGETTKCRRCDLDEQTTLRFDILNHELSGLCNTVRELYRMVHDHNHSLLLLEKLMRDLAEDRLSMPIAIPVPNATTQTTDARWKVSSSVDK